jgi:hypothetical protein
MDVCSLLGCEGKPNNKAKLFFIPCAADNPTNSSHEISEHVLFRYLLNDCKSLSIREKFRNCKLMPIPREIHPESKITQVETHRRSESLSISFQMFQTGIRLSLQLI